ncbi:PREDICTED: FIP1[V]-like protein [Tarenaya hassleriana]|uniref:FIP1[V]-like protein n=1 Tax=Tarenaya hassleriana TaxID=28532 RepID=UPI00053C5A50|nr:PREDICTED: FIP1[V]-like protein [Tarenaya hassleriana]
MDEDDEFGDLYTDVLQPFKPSAAPPPPPLHPPIDLNLQSLHQDIEDDGATAVSRVSDIEPSKLSSPAIDMDMKFDIEDADTDALPAIPGESLPALPTDRGRSGIGKLSDGAMREQGDGEGGDWDSDSDDDLQIVLNDSSRNSLIGAGRRANPDEDDEEDDEEPLVIVTDTDPNQAMEGHIWAEDSLQATEGDGKDAGEAGKASGAGAVAAPPKIGYIGHGYHTFHSQFKYVRPGAAPMAGATASTAGTSSGQVRPPVNVVPMAGRGRGDWRRLGFGTGWGSNTAGRGVGVGLDFTLPSHKTIFEVDIDGFEEKPWRYPGVDTTDFFNFGLNEESWKDYCKQLDQHRVETTMQSRIRVYESGRTDQGYDPDLPPELAAATGAQGIPADSSNLVKPTTTQGDSTKGPAHVRPALPPGRPIPVETGSGERLPSIDTRAPRIRDADAIIEIVCQDSREAEPSSGNDVDQVGNSLPGENILGDVNSGSPDTGSSCQAPTQDELAKRLHDKQEDAISENTDGRCSLRSSSPIGGRDTRSSSVDQKDTGAEPSKYSEMEEERKMSSELLQSVVQEDDGGESKTERSSESSKAKSGNHREYQQSKDSAVDARRPSSGKQLHENSQHQSRKNQDREQETERTRVAASKGGRENSYPHMEFDSSYPRHSYTKGEDFDKRKECDIAGSVWHRREDEAYSRKSRDEGSRKRDRGDYLGSRHRGKMRESETYGKDDHVPSRKHLDDGGMRVPSDKDFGSRPKERDDSLRNNYEVMDDYVSKRRKDEEYLRRSRSDKNEISHSQRESSSHPKRERGDRLEDQKRAAQKIREDFGDFRSFGNRDEFYVQRDGNERQRECEDLDNLRRTREEDSSVHGRERRVTTRNHRDSEDRASRMKDEYKGSDKELLNKDTARHNKHQKRRENAYEESSSHNGGHEETSTRQDITVNNEKKLRQERASGRSDKISDPSDGKGSQEKKHKESRRKNKEHRIGDAADLGPLRSKQEEQNGSFEELGSKRANKSRSRNTARRNKEDVSSDEEQQNSKRGRLEMEHWTNHKEREDFTLPAKSSSSSVPLKFQEMDKSPNGRSAEEGREAAHDPTTEKNRDANEEKNAAEMKHRGQKPPPGDRHLETVEKLKKRSERFKLPMPNEDNIITSTVKKTETETDRRTEGAADSEVKAERPARKRRWTSS